MHVWLRTDASLNRFQFPVADSHVAKGIEAMNNATVVIATTFALVSTALAVEIARRHPAAEAMSTAPIAKTDAPAPTANADGGAKPEAPEAAKQASVLEDVGAEKPLAAPTPTQAASTEPTTKAQEDSPPMRDASFPAPDAAALTADAKRDAGSIVEPNDEKTSRRQPSLFAIPQGPAAEAAAKDGQQPKAIGERKKSKSANDTAFVKPAIVKSGRGKSETEKATTDRMADAAKPVRPHETQHRVAKAHCFGRDPGQERSERYAAARAVPTVQWQGGYGADLHPGGDVYGFSGSFGGCRYRGFVSMTGYRIESSC
jgi:hypothetical protein